MECEPHLIVLRGNSAAGKSTLAVTLQHGFGPGTAVIGQDHFRRVVLREHDVPNGDNIGLIAHTVRYCASIGYNVILEGILLAKHYRDMLRHVLIEHPGPTHIFYLDVPLEETLRRHQMRPLAADVSEDQLRDWFTPPDPLDVAGEVVLDGTADLRTTLTVIREHVGSITSKPSQDHARFL